jgi:hypothetical protein
MEVRVEAGRRMGTMTYYGIKRKIFISFYKGNKPEVDNFIDKWVNREAVFIPKALGISDNDDFINSNDPEYVISQIRQKYLSDSTVTIVLIGKCTHSRRYVDWELKTSLRSGKVYTPNGLIGILLPSSGESAHLPPRFQDNWNKDGNCYARYYYSPTSANELGGWIEDAYAARSNRANMIQNNADMMKYNAKCLFCNTTH